MRRQEPVDLRKFAEFLEQHPDVYPMYRSLKSGDRPRSPEQKERARRNNLAWARKIREGLTD